MCFYEYSMKSMLQHISFEFQPAQRTDIEENNQTRQSELLELQLKVVSSFFDQCVPNQPGEYV